MTSSHPVLLLFHIRCHHLRFKNFLYILRILQFPSIPPVQSDAYSLAGHLALLFHKLLEYISYFIPSTNDRAIVNITGSTCFSLHTIPQSHRSSFFPIIWGDTTLIFSSSFQTLYTQNNVRITHNALFTHTHINAYDYILQNREPKTCVFTLKRMYY